MENDSTAIKIKQEDCETVRIKEDNSAANEIKQNDNAAVEIKQDDSAADEIKQNDNAAVEIKQEGCEIVTINQDGCTTVMVNQEGCGTVKVNQEGCETVKINNDDCETVKVKHEKPDDYEVSATVTQTSTVSAQSYHGNVVFTYKTSDNDSITVMKSEPSIDEDVEDGNSDEQKPSLLGEGTVNSCADTHDTPVVNSCEDSHDTPAVNSCEDSHDAPAVNSGEETTETETATKMFVDEAETNKAVQQVLGVDGKGNKVVILRPNKRKIEEMQSNGNVVTIEIPGKKAKIRLENLQKIELKNLSLSPQNLIKFVGPATVNTELLTVGHPTETLGETSGTGGARFVQIRTTEEEKRQTQSLGKESEEKGCKVVVLRLPKHEAEEVWRNDKAANKVIQEKLDPTAKHQLVERCIQHPPPLPPPPPPPQPPPPPPPVTVIAQRVQLDHNSEVKYVESVTSSKSKPSCNILKCLFCGRKFTQIVRYRHHMKTHMEKKPVVCGKCDSDFYFQSSFEEHFRKSHIMYKLHIAYLCSACQVQVQEDELSTHLLQHQTSHNFRCGICGDALSCCQELLSHVTQHENNMPVKCGVCSRVHTNFEDLESHLKDHFEEGQYICEMCNQKFKTAVEFSEHCKLHSSLLPFQCDACNIRMRNRADLNYHKKRCPERQVEHKCQLCPAVFRIRGDLMLHNEFEHPFCHCHFCGTSFSKRELLTDHMKTHKLVASFI